MTPADMPFRLDLVRAGGGAFQATIWLDPRQPYLSDHCPGELPLLGTTIGLEIMRAAVYGLTPGLCIRLVELFEIHAALVVASGACIAVDVTASLHAREDGGSIGYCEISSRHGGPRVLHFRARLHLGRHSVPIPDGARCRPHLNKEVAGESIYKLFFHGPGFQVIGVAGRCQGRMYARLAERLPPLFLPPISPDTTPQLVEFAMQTAGLYELAINQRMMIPHRIRRLEVYERAAKGELWAIAERCDEGRVGEPTDLNVTVVDDSGQVHVALFGYSTVPIPFPIENGALVALLGQFG